MYSLNALDCKLLWIKASAKWLNVNVMYIIMEEWKRTPVATCEALVNSMPKRVKAVLEK